MNHKENHKKIVITGGLGYIGTALCNLYSGQARYKNITVIDSKFISARVAQLRAWDINYVQASILDKEVLAQHMHDADVVIHLAGITDVAYTKTESNDEKDKEIREIGITGTLRVIDACGKHTKIIFPSTHVVFEGLKETREQIEEHEPMWPVLTYADSKVTNEHDIMIYSSNYIILRLASVYGDGGDSTRIGIMPNLFSKIASQANADCPTISLLREPSAPQRTGGIQAEQNVSHPSPHSIKLFSGGIQLKSLVALQDVARCMQFMEERDDIKNEIFHLSNESMTVKQVAELCKKYSPNLQLIETNDEIPNRGYTISNKKLLNTGFKFLYNIETSIKEMISNWSPRTINPALEYIDKGGNEYEDARGKINNYELTEPINLVGLISSNRGSVRANHYHPIQEQKCLLVEGEYISVIKDLSVPDAPIETKLVRAGDMAIIKPNVAHAMVFTHDSVFLNLVRGERDHDKYGITHTIPYKLVDNEFSKQLISTYKTNCRVCSGAELKRVISLGLSPLANNLMDDADTRPEAYPLEMDYCPECHNCQLNTIVPAGKMFDNYLYVSSTSASFRKHFEDACEKYVKEFKLNKKSLVIDIGSNDGIALKPFKKKGVNVLGVEPAKNLASIAGKKNKVKTINRYFDAKTGGIIHKLYPKGADLITASNVFAHADRLDRILSEMHYIIKRKGTFIIEVQYLYDTIKDLTFDNIYHEHVNYWSLTALNHFCKSRFWKVYKVEHIPTHGGSIRVYISPSAKKEVDSSVIRMLQLEADFKMHHYKTYTDFAERVHQVRNNVRTNFAKLKEKYTDIAIYGAPAKATTSLNYYGLSGDDIMYAIDDNELKHGKYIPCLSGKNIPIIKRRAVFNNAPKLIIVMAWNFYDEIVKNNSDLIEQGVRLVSIKDLQNKPE